MQQDSGVAAGGVEMKVIDQALGCVLRALVEKFEQSTGRCQHQQAFAGLEQGNAPQAYALEVHDRQEVSIIKSLVHCKARTVRRECGA